MLNLRTSRARFVPVVITSLVTLGGMALGASPAHADNGPCVPLNWPGGGTQLCAPDTGSTSGGLNEGLSDVATIYPLVVPAAAATATGAPNVTVGWRTISGSTTTTTTTGTTTAVTCQLGWTATGGWAVSCPTALPAGAQVISVVNT